MTLTHDKAAFDIIFKKETRHHLVARFLDELVSIV